MEVRGADPRWAETCAAFTPELCNAREQTWAELYRELHDNASAKIKQWSQQIHAVGQNAKMMVEIKSGGERELMYALLGEHVRFTAADQQAHTTILMQLHSIFADGAGGNVHDAIEDSRRPA